VVVKWQKAEKKWMDGAFLELNAESTEAEVNKCTTLYCVGTKRFENVCARTSLTYGSNVTSQ
jgi:hypothetical protein